MIEILTLMHRKQMSVPKFHVSAVSIDNFSNGGREHTYTHSSHANIDCAACNLITNERRYRNESQA